MARGIDDVYTSLNTNTNDTLNTQRAFANEIKTANNTMIPNDSNDNGLLQTSTNIFIRANSSIVGMVQSFTINESRTINKLQAVGWEGVVQAVPSNTNGGSLNVSRIALYQSNLWNALGLTNSGKAFNPLTGTENGKMKSNDNVGAPGSIGVFKTLKDQRIPFEVQVQTKSSKDSYYTETYVDCWLASYSKSYTVSTITVAETATIQYADVY